MNINKFRTFVIAAGCNAFFEAAEELGISTATVSKHIASLEKELGVPLFERVPHGVRLTKNGWAKLHAAERLVESYDLLVNLSETVGEQKLQLYSMPQPGRFELSDTLKAFSEKHAAVSLEIVEKHRVDKAIENGNCELGLIAGIHNIPDQLECIVVLRTRLGVLVSEKHPLSGKKSVAIKELRDEEFIFPNPEDPIYKVYLDYCLRCGFTPNIKQTVFRDDSIMFQVSHNQGISFFARDMLSLYKLSEVCFVPLREKMYSGCVLARAKSRPLSPAAETFWNFMKSVYGQPVDTIC